MENVKIITLENLTAYNNRITGRLDALETISAQSHTHSNKSLLDSYNQTNTNLADAVSKKHNHSNKTALDKIISSGDGTKYLKDDGTYDYVYVFNRLYTEYSYECTQQGMTPMSYEDFVERMMINLSIQTPTTTSQLTNNSGFITSDDIPAIPTKTSELTNDNEYITESQVQALIDSAIIITLNTEV